MAPIRDKLFVIGLIVLTALAIAAVPRIHAEPGAAGNPGAAAPSEPADPIIDEGSPLARQTSGSDDGQAPDALGR